MSGRSFLCGLWFSQTLRHKNYIDRLASLYGRPKTSEKQTYITLKSNPSKVQKRLLGLYTYKTQLTADFGQIWVPEN